MDLPGHCRRHAPDRPRGASAPMRTKLTPIHSLPILLALLATSMTLHAQRSLPDPNDSTRQQSVPDTSRTLRSDSLRADSLGGDSLALRPPIDRGIDTVIVYSATDSIVFDLQSRKITLDNDAIPQCTLTGNNSFYTRNRSCAVSICSSSLWLHSEV